MVHTCVEKLSHHLFVHIMACRLQDIIWTNIRFVVIGTLEKRMSIYFESYCDTFETRNELKTPSAKWRPFCVGLSMMTVPKSGGIPSWSKQNVIMMFYMMMSWCHKMETFFVLLAFCAGNSPVTGEFPSKSAVSSSSNVFFGPRLNNKRLSKQSRSLWRHCNDKYRNI